MRPHRSPAKCLNDKKYLIDAAASSHRLRRGIVQVKLLSGPAVHMGLIVDSVKEVVTLNVAEIEPTSEFGARIDTCYLLGMAKLKCSSISTVLLPVIR